jgi:hypothetical protein
MLKGQVVCDVTNVRVVRGQRKYTRIEELGNGQSEQIPGNKEPDKVTFSVPPYTHLDLNQSYELVENDGTVLRILIERRTGNNVVEAVIQKK